DYGIYLVAGASIVFAVGGLRGFADTRDRGILFSGMVSMAFTAAAIIYTQCPSIVICYMLNIVVSYFWSNYALSPLPPLDSERSDRPSPTVPDESEFERHVERQLQGVMPPTELLIIRPSEYLPHLRAKILVSRAFLFDRMAFNRKQTIGGNFFDRVAREVL